MAYDFVLGGPQYISWEPDPSNILYQAQDLTVAFWVKFNTSFADDQNILGRNDNFPVFTAHGRTTVSNGYGVTFEHIIGGGAAFGVTVIPGQVNPVYKQDHDQWLFYAVTRNFSGRSYQSYFGSKSAIIVGPSGTWPGAGQNPLPIGTPGQVVGVWFAGQNTGTAVGPAYYYDTILTQQDIQSLARCVLPADVPTLHLLWYTKMQLGAADNGPNHFNAAFHDNPQFEEDDGCKSFGGRHYQVYNT